MTRNAWMWQTPLQRTRWLNFTFRQLAEDVAKTEREPARPFGMGVLGTQAPPFGMGVLGGPQEPFRPSGLTGTIHDIMRLTGRVAGEPELEEAFQPQPYGLAPPLPLPFDQFRQSLISERGFTPGQAKDTLRYYSLLNTGLAEQEASSRLYEEKYGEPLAPPTVPEPYPVGDERARERYEQLYPEGRELRPQGLYFDPEKGRFTTGLAPMIGGGPDPLPGVMETLLEQKLPVHLAGPLAPAVQAAEEVGLVERPTIGEAAEAGGRAQQRFLDPQAALFLQMLEAHPEVALQQEYVLKPLAEKLGVPEAYHPGLEFGAPKPSEVVVPPKAWFGDEEEQAKVHEVLVEVGVPNAVAAIILTDPGWLVPGMGITKARHFTGLIRQASRLKGAARARILESPTFRKGIDAIMSEAGHARVPGGGAARVPPDDPLRTGLVKIEKYFHDVARKRPDIMAARKVEHAERATAHRQLRQRYIDEGLSVPEANARADAALKGKYTTAAFKGAGLTDEEVEAFWKVALDEPLEFESRRAIETMAMAHAGEYVQPSRVALIRRLYGDALADMIESAQTDTVRYLKEMREIYGRKGIPRAGEPEDITGVSYELEPAKAKIKARDAKLYLGDALNALKIRQTLMTIIDISAGLRQAAKLGFRNPVEWWRGMKAGWRAVWSETDAVAMQTAMETDERVIRVVTAEGMADVPYGRVQMETMDTLRPLPGTERARAADILTREEIALAENFNRVVGVKQSMQAFVVMLNKMRSDVAWKMIQLATSQGRPLTPELLRDIGNLVNRMTGRGEVGGGWFAKLLKGLGFAPGYRISGPQMYLQLFHRGTPHSGFIRRQAAENLAAYLSAGSTLLALAYVGGKKTGFTEVVVDPFDADFGKVRIGDAHYNIWGTDQVLVRHIAMFAFAQRRTSAGEMQDVERIDMVLRYLRSGADPFVGTVIDLGTEKTYLGEPAGFNLETLWREVRRSTPMSLQDVADIYREEGILHALVATPYIMAGGTVSAYKSQLEVLANAYNQEVQNGTFGDDALPYVETDRTLRSYNIQQVSGLREIDEAREIESRMESDAFKAEKETEYDLPNLARRFLDGDTSVGAELMRRYQEYRDDVRKGYARLLFGEELKAETEGEKLIEAWADVNPNDPKYFDEDLKATDWDGFYEDLDAAFAKIQEYNPRLAEALKFRLSTADPKLRELEPQLKSAIALKAELYDIPRWTGIKPEKQREIEKLQKLTDKFRDRLAAAGLDPGSATISQYQDAARLAGLDPRLAFVAWPLRGGDSEARAQNLEYQKFLFKRQKELAVFFPDLYGSRAMLPFLEPDIQQSVIAAAR